MREFCFTCRKAKITCYCAQLRPFESTPRFVILIHPRELRNSIATGRMLHLSIRNSLLIDGRDFTDDERVNSLIRDPALHCALLYPGARSLNLSHCSAEQAREFTPAGKQLVLFIVDGTWELARATVHRSINLKRLPQLEFTPKTTSVYKIRQQPETHCLSTLESAHWIIERFAELGIHPRLPGNAHHGLLDVFNYMINQQVDYAIQGKQVSP